MPIKECSYQRDYEIGSKVADLKKALQRLFFGVLAQSLIRIDKENLECQKYVKYVAKNQWLGIMSAMRII